MTVLALKVALAPLLVVLATLAGRRWGSLMGGIVTALPIVAGPILAIVAIEHGTAFAETAARSALLGVIALAMWCAACARAAQAGVPWPLALVAGTVAYAVVAAIASRFDLPAVAGFALALAALALAALIIGRPSAVVGPRHPPPGWDLPARALLTAVLVVVLTGIAGDLGPRTSGVLTPFPVAASVVVGFVLAQDGPDRARDTLRGFVRGLPGFAVCFLVAALAL